MRDRLAALQQSSVGRFAQKFLEDRGIDLAMLIAWGTLSTIFPVLLGITGVAGVLLQDPERSARISNTLVQLVPAEAAQPLAAILDDTRRNGGAAGIVGLVLLLFNGSNLFANMESVFDRAYHVPDRDLVQERLISLLMLIIVTALLLISAVASSLGAVLGSASDAVFRALPFELPGRGLAGLLIGYGLSIGSALLMFLLLYRILPNKQQSFRQVLPGALMAAVLFFVLLQVFPLYTRLFGEGFATFAAFGMFLLLMFWTYLLGIVLVLGAELNAFLGAAD
ncbi:MAG: YihY/virulence factor BrkB family protein [Chloroflexota bacterium]|nr:YihY/virulence factor BrkB family protein [Chloroflexota bacterium]